MLASRQTEKVRVRSAGADAAAGESKPTTDPSRLNMAERGSRAAGQNALEVSIGVSGDGLNNILARVLLTAAGPTESMVPAAGA